MFNKVLPSYFNGISIAKADKQFLKSSLSKHHIEVLPKQILRLGTFLTMHLSSIIFIFFFISVIELNDGYDCDYRVSISESTENSGINFIGMVFYNVYANINEFLLVHYTWGGVDYVDEFYHNNELTQYPNSK